LNWLHALSIMPWLLWLSGWHMMTCCCCIAPGQQAVETQAASSSASSRTLRLL
jgi:hypothetical protein